MYIEECSLENEIYFQPEELFLKLKAVKCVHVGMLWISTCKYQQYKNNQEWNKKLDGALSSLICWEELLHMAEVDF